MNIGNILLHSAAENTDPDSGAAAWAVGAAGQFGARLTALVYQLDVVMPRSARGAQTAAESRADPDGRARGTREAAASLQNVAQRAGVEIDIVADRSYAYGVPEIVAGRARLHDLVVSGVDQTGLLSERSIAEHLLFEAGRPLVIVPAKFTTPFQCERLVVAWDWSRAAARALGDAMPLLRSATDVRIVSFGDEKEFDTTLREDDLLEALRRRRVTARFECLERGDKPIGEALCAAALDRGADLLVMGGYGHSRLRQFVLGGATRAMLDGPGLPTLLSQ